MNKKAAFDFITRTAFSFTCILGILICAICNFSTSGKLTWGLYPITCILFLWLIIVPLFLFKKNKAGMALVSFSIFIIPFLFILDKIIGGTKLMLSLGISVSLISIFYMWVIYLMFVSAKASKWIIVSFSVLIGIPVGVIINSIVSKYTDQPLIDAWDLLSYGIMMIISIAIFLIGKIRAVNRFAD